MPEEHPQEEFSSLSDEVRELWNRNAEWWDAYVGAEGNRFHRLLVAPATERLLDLRPGEAVLDVACGNGQFARRMADLGAHVTACDISEKFIESAKARSEGYGDRIQYMTADATDRARMVALGRPRRFDAAVCTMAIMDMTRVEPLASALPELLKPGGRFVFSVMHPCFNSTGTRMLVEEAYQGTELRPAFAIRVTEYIRPAARPGVGIVGQPVAHYYFHRPIGMLLGAFLQAGLVLDGLEEPVFDATVEPKGVFSWGNYTQIPPVLVARLRPR